MSRGRERIGVDIGIGVAFCGGSCDSCTGGTWEVPTWANLGDTLVFSVRWRGLLCGVIGLFVK